MTPLSPTGRALVPGPFCLGLRDGAEPYSGRRELVRLLVVVALFLAAWFLTTGGPPAREVSGQSGIVWLDPGHGGIDPGAVSAGGVLEKHVVLQIAHIAARALRARGYAARLTRMGDHAVAAGRWDVTRDLHARAGLANGAGGSVFVSLHANSEPTGTVRGPIVYYLRGNAVSRRLADSIEVALRAMTGIGHAPRPAGHLVLRLAGMPAVTVEVGFLSHPTEAGSLAAPGAQALLGEAVALGISRYVGGAGSVATGMPP